MNIENIPLLPILFAIAAAGILFLPERIWAKAKIGSGIGLIFAYAFLHKDLVTVPVQNPQLLLEIIVGLPPEDQITNYIALGYLGLIVAYSIAGAFITALTLGKREEEEETA